jgi:hypothetical protein
MLCQRGFAGFSIRTLRTFNSVLEDLDFVDEGIDNVEVVELDCGDVDFDSSDFDIVDLGFIAMDSDDCPRTSVLWDNSLPRTAYAALMSKNRGKAVPGRHNAFSRKVHTASGAPKG